MINETINGIIISRKNIGEADRLLTIFSKERGKIKVIARGARKIKSKMAAHVEPFTVGRFQIVSGKSFYVLTGAERDSLLSFEYKDINNYKSAAYLCEILDLTTQEESGAEKIYNLLIRILRILPTTDKEKIETLVYYFEFSLLSYLGYQANYKKCIRCGQDLSENQSFKGGFEGVNCVNCSDKCNDHKSVSKNTLKILDIFKNTNLEKILKISGIEKYNGELCYLIRPYLYDILPRTPKSLNL